MTLRSLALPLALIGLSGLLSTACSTSTDGDGSGGAPANTGEHYSFKFTTAPGEETHWCQYTRLPDGGGKGVAITGFSWSWTNMHHWAMYKTTADLPADVKLDEPFDCFAPGGMKYASPGSLILGGGEKGTQTFPKGTGLTFKPGEVVIVQAHTVNASSAPLPVTLDVDVDTVPPEEVPNPLGLIQFYDPYIVVPPHAAARAQMRCNIPKDMTVLFGSTHQHTRGTEVNVFLDPPSGARADQPFLTSKDWEHPAVANTLELEAGSYVRTVCDYMGDENEVIQGQNRDSSEMCMFIGYYYPIVSEDETERGLFENCVQDSFPKGVGDEYGAGAVNCADSLTCIQSCPPGDAPNPTDGRIDVGACWQKCLVNSCASASEPLNALGYCVQTQCATECSGGDCASCVVSKCKDSYVACQSNACASPAP
ncbi:MAG: hypothetical protein U0414_20530 [Polyangiaceae bacterium]